jgi:succinyl-diaminopimelate desuccinylase
VPAVEFGPIGGGHHGPGEWVSISSLASCRRALGRFVTALPALLELHSDEPGEGGLRALDGGLA